MFCGCEEDCGSHCSCHGDLSKINGFIVSVTCNSKAGCRSDVPEHFKRLKGTCPSYKENCGCDRQYDCKDDGWRP